MNTNFGDDKIQQVCFLLEICIFYRLREDSYTNFGGDLERKKENRRSI